MVRGQEIKPGRVVVLQKDLKKDLKKMRRDQQEANAAASSGVNFMAGIDPSDVYSVAAAARAAIANYSVSPLLTETAAAEASPASLGAQSPESSEFICELCMRKFSTKENLTRHEQFSDLHKENLAKLEGEDLDGDDWEGE